jgi:gamma-glutamylcysteine synthetase
MIRRIFTEEEVFDLELKAHGRVQYELGRSAERERIIELLDKLRDSEYAEVMDHNQLIALIEEEVT